MDIASNYKIWTKNCLICLQKSSNLLSLTTDNEKNGNIGIKLEKCSSYKISDLKSNSFYPSNICSKCYTDLLAAYKFSKLVEESKSKLDIFYEKLKKVYGKQELCLQCEKQEKKARANDSKIEFDDNSIAYYEEHIDSEFENSRSNDQVEIYYEISNEPKCKEDSIGKTTELMDIVENLEVLEEKVIVKTEEDMENVKKDVKIQYELMEVVENIPQVKQKPTPRKKYTKKLSISNDIDVIETLETMKESRENAAERKEKDRNQKVICDLCGNYYNVTQLRYHRMRHDEVKRYPCEICQRRFATETDLKRHMRVHTGEKPYGCQYCERKFSDYGSRIKHERCHTGEKPYMCDVCKKCFTYSHALKKHQQVHTGYKEFNCDQCGKGFTKKEYLKNHMMRHTSNNEKPKVPKVPKEKPKSGTLIIVKPQPILQTANYEEESEEIYYELDKEIIEKSVTVIEDISDTG